MVNKFGWPNKSLQPRVFSDLQRQTHTYMIGQPGTGKSRLIESWVMQDILSGRGVGVIDPHGDLFQNLIHRIACYPKVWPRLIIIDPLNPKWAVNVNPLFPRYGISVERTAYFLSDIISKIWGINAMDAPRMSWLMVNTFIALAESNLSLLELPQFLMHGEDREKFLQNVGNDHTKFYFRYEFPKNNSAIHQWITPLMNKLGQMVLDADIRPMLARGSGLDFKQVMNNRSILLVNIPKGCLGEGSSALLGAFIVAQLQKAALSRASQNQREPFYLYLDEFQNYTTDNIKDILSESRKYGLSLILANQYLQQLTTDIRAAVLNTSGTIVSFRVGHEDACHLAKAIFPFQGFLNTVKTKVELNKFMTYPYLSLQDTKQELGWDGLSQLIAGLPYREFWIRNKSNTNPIHCRSFDMPDVSKTHDIDERVAEMIETSGRRYARLKYLKHSMDYGGFPNKDRAYPSAKDTPRENAANFNLWGR